MSSRERLQQSLKHIRRQLEALEGQLEATTGLSESLIGSAGGQPAEAASMVDTRLDLPAINAIFRDLAAEASRQRILVVYLEGVMSLVERVILFSRAGRSFVPWKAMGFELAKLPILSLEQEEDPLVQSALQKQIVISGRDAEGDFPWAGEDGGKGRWACCMPMIVGDSVPMILYADSRNRLPLDSLELLTQLVILVLKNHELRRRLASQQVDTGSSPEANAYDLEELEPRASVEG